MTASAQFLLCVGLPILIIDHTAVGGICPPGTYLNTRRLRIFPAACIPPCTNIRILPTEQYPSGIRRNLHLIVHHDHVLGERTLHIKFIHKMRIPPPAVLRIIKTSAIPHDRQQICHIKMAMCSAVRTIPQHRLYLFPRLPAFLPAPQHHDTNIV